MCIFFFQAEDGIRDGRVTGVQTCALPISSPVILVHVATAPNAVLRTLPALPPHLWAPSLDAVWALSAALVSAYAPPHRRSEERRVGKECRSRWSPYH